ncbi:amidase [Saccharibacillus sp. O23]|uniref:amidase family protein n=1 Tax=Saccharibacillus sp. O23 TaxID=2009338 RepID=UPI000B4E3DE1|nr:amidase family protein [Saccharibacillus sp. O23]OWR30406.1 amidase [Saccharibacillus sp. O23]
MATRKKPHKTEQSAPERQQLPISAARPDPRGVPVENEIVSPPPNPELSKGQALAEILASASGWNDPVPESRRTERSEEADGARTGASRSGVRGQETETADAASEKDRTKPTKKSQPAEERGAPVPEAAAEVPEASEHPDRKIISRNAAHDREEIREEDLSELTIARFKEKLQSGRWTCLQLTQAYIRRIKQLDGRVNAVLELNPDAEALAKQLDDNFDELGGLPLYGVPILLKDNIDTGDRMVTAAGSLALRERRASEDAFAVAKLREAGAILLGKVNMTEWANYMSWDMPSGYSSRGGQTLNPYGDYPVGGSSSGSAAAVAANFALGAIGSETSGSIVDPAAACSVVGIKPTVGLISRSGVIPLSLTQDTLGPIARTVLDAALILEAMAFGDEAADCSQPQRPVSFLPGRDDLPVPLKVGVVKAAAEELDAETSAVFEQALGGLEAAGIRVRRGLELPPYADEWDGTVLRREFKTAIDAFFAAQPEGTAPADLGELIAVNRENEASNLRYGQQLLEEAEQSGGSLEDEEYLTSRERGVRRMGAEGTDRALTEYDVHALVFPGSSGADLAARVGYPLLSVPAGYTESGRPVGLLLSGAAMSDALLIEIAYRFERAHRARKSPETFGRLSPTDAGERS